MPCNTRTRLPRRRRPRAFRPRRPENPRRGHRSQWRDLGAVSPSSTAVAATDKHAAHEPARIRNAALDLHQDVSGARCAAIIVRHRCARVSRGICRARSRTLGYRSCSTPRPTRDFAHGAQSVHEVPARQMILDVVRGVNVPRGFSATRGRPRPRREWNRVIASRPAAPRYASIATSKPCRLHCLDRRGLRNAHRVVCDEHYSYLHSLRRSEQDLLDRSRASVRIDPHHHDSRYQRWMLFGRHSCPATPGAAARPSAEVFCTDVAHQTRARRITQRHVDATHRHRAC